MIGALMVAFSPNFAVLLIGVILMGIAVGAGVPASWTYIAEEAPSGAARRSRRHGPIGLVDRPGHRLPARRRARPARHRGVADRTFFHLFVIAAVTWWVRRGLPESKRWKEQRESDRTSGQKVSIFSGMRGLLSDRRNLGALAFLLGVYGLWNTVAGQAGIFQPRVYDAAGLHDPCSRTCSRFWCGR